MIQQDMRWKNIRVIVTVAILGTITGCELLPWAGQVRTIDELTEVTDSVGNTYRVGFDQVTSIRQDPFVEKLRPDGSTAWRIRHDETPADARGIAISLDEADIPYVVFSIDGGSNAGSRFQRNHVKGTPFSSAPFPGYGPGGGGKVTVVARLNPDTGRISAGTFIIAQLNNGNTNTFRPYGISVRGDRVWVGARSAA